MSTAQLSSVHGGEGSGAGYQAAMTFLNSFTEIQLTHHTIHPFKVFNLVAFGTFPELCDHPHAQL